MVSSRRMRSSRLPSPANATTTDSEPSSIEAKGTSYFEGNEWKEPGLRPPAPSFEDYKGYERNSILKNMMPLGHFPSQKEKDRILRSDLPLSKRTALSKNGKNGRAKEDSETREATPIANNTGAQEPASKDPLMNGKKGDRISGSATPGGTSTLVKATGQKPPETSVYTDPNGPMRLKCVVESALQRATEQGNPYLGRAIERLWQDSFQEPKIADLMDAVLSRKPSTQQTSEFQERVKIARKACKDADMSARQSSTGAASASKSSVQSPSKSDRGSVARRPGTADDVPDALGSKANRDANPPSSKRQAKHMDANGTPSKPERASKRSRRLKSFSSTSSLSSISSTENELPPPNDKGSSAPPLPLQSPERQTNGPKLHSFPLNTRYKASRRPPTDFEITQSAEDTVEETDAKRRTLRRAHNIIINDSDVRRPLSGTPQRTRKSEQPNPSITIRTTPSRLRNGAIHQNLADDVDVESSLSPVDGELLAPPFPTDQIVTRNATPTRLGRPPKNVKKSARVKMSPQKAKGITAGRARSAGDIEAPTANSNERDNEDYCSACGGTGQLLCCDNCVRSFHFTCLEPPQDEENAPEGSWFCRACHAEKHDMAAENDDVIPLDSETESWAQFKDGVLGPLFGKLHGKIERAYALPKIVAEAFEGVKTGDTGEYEEVALPRTRARTTEDTLADITKFKHRVKDDIALCFKCGCSSNDLREGNPQSDVVPREIVQCDYCTLAWHLDCVDPPLAFNPKTTRPVLNGKTAGARNKQTAVTWMCPNHATTDDPNESRHSVSRTINGRIGKVRRPKHATIRDVNLRRGFHNNGLIEILNDPSEDEEEDDAGVIYRISERGIKLDFIDRVRQSRTNRPLTSSDALNLRRAATRREREKAAAKAEREELRRRSFAEQQVALTLANLQSAGSRSPLNVASQPSITSSER